MARSRMPAGMRFRSRSSTWASSRRRQSCATGDGLAVAGHGRGLDELAMCRVGPAIAVGLEVGNSDRRAVSLRRMVLLACSSRPGRHATG